MINILTIYNSYALNGVSAVIYQYYKNLDNNKFKFHFIYSDKIVDKYKNEFGKEVLIKIDGRNTRPISYLKELIEVIHKYRIDVVHVHGNSSTIFVELLAAKIAGVKIRIAHSHNTTCSHKIINNILRLPFYSTYSQAIGCGEEAGRWMFGRRDFLVLKNGIDLNYYAFNDAKRTSLRKKMNLDGKFILGHIGRFTEQKNHRKLLEIFESVAALRDDAHLLMVGEGPLKDEIISLVKSKGLESKVTFYGTTNRSDIIYSAIDVFVFPSLFEGVPLTLIEAQASGLPCVISNTISKEVALTKLVKMVPLPENDKWIDSINSVHENRVQSSCDAVKTLREAGFDIKDVVSKLDSIYSGEVL